MLLLATIEDLVPEADEPQARRRWTTSGFAAGFVTWAMTTFGVAYVGLLLPTIVLVAHGSGSAAIGSPVHFRGMKVGRVLGAEYDAAKGPAISWPISSTLMPRSGPEGGVSMRAGSMRGRVRPPSVR